MPALSDEWDRLTQGNHTSIESTDTIEFVNHFSVPTDRKVTYTSFVCDYRPLRDKKWRIRLVAENDKLPYDADLGLLAIHLLETEILFNSVILDAKNVAIF